MRILRIIEMFMLLEIGEEILEAAGFVAQLRPVIIVHRLTSVVHLVVDSTGSSQAFSLEAELVCDSHKTRMTSNPISSSDGC
jgi:hypothetical protein